MPRRVSLRLVVPMAGLFVSAAQLPGQTPSSQPHVEFFSGPCVMALAGPDAPLYRVTGRVVDDLTSAPLSQATVVLSSDCLARDENGQRTPNNWTAQVVSDEQGAFRFDNVPAMRAFISANLQGYQDLQPLRRAAGDPLSRYSIGENTAPIKLRLAPSPSISGVVRGPDHIPFAHARVSLWCYRTWAGWRQLQYCNTLPTAADGSYRFPSLFPGRYLVVAEPWQGMPQMPKSDPQGRTIGYVPVSYPTLSADGSVSFMELAEGQQARVDFELKPEALHHITGTVTGRDVWPPIIDLVDAAGSKSYVLKTAARCCRFEAWVPNGRFSLEAQFTSVDGEFIGSTPVEVRDADVDGVVFSLTKRTGMEIPIEIRPADTGKADLVGKALSLQLIHLKPNGDVDSVPQSTMAGWMKPASVRRESITATTGSYAVALTATGNVYARSISRGATDLIREPLIVGPGDAPEMIHVIVAEGAMVDGVTRREGSPMPAWVYAVPERADARLLNAVASDANGKFRLEGLAPDRYLFFASDVEIPLDVHNAAEMSHWQKVGQSLTLEAGKTASVELGVQIRSPR
jgi:hypothetical protein